MKTTTKKIVIKNLCPALAAMALFVCASRPAMGALDYWDNNGLSTPSSGTWDNSSLNWSTTSALTGSPVAFPAGTPGGTTNAAVFVAGPTALGPVTITVNSAINITGLFDGGISGVSAVTNLDIAQGGSGSLNLEEPNSSTSTPAIYVTNGATTEFDVPITGNGSSTYLIYEGGGTVNLYAPNTYLGTTQLGIIGTGTSWSGTVNFNNSTPFSAGQVNLTGYGSAGGTLVNTSGISIMLANNFSAVNTSGNINLNIVPGSAGTIFNGTWNLGAVNVSLGTGPTAGNVVTLNGPITSTGNLVVYNPGTMSWATTESITGNVIVSNGAVLSLTSGGSISSAASLSIQAGSTFDVSADTGGYGWNQSTTLNASGAGTVLGTTAAAINGGSGGYIQMGYGENMNLTYAGTGFPGDATHPSLDIFGASVNFGNNQIEVNNASSSALSAGNYTLITLDAANTGSLQGSVTGSPIIVSGLGLAGTSVAFASTSGSAVVLTVQVATTATTTTLAPPVATYSVLPTNSITQPGGAPTTFEATVSPVPTGGNVQFYVDGVAVGPQVPVDTGTGMATTGSTPVYTPTTTGGGTHVITAVFSGSPDTTYASSTSAPLSQTVKNANTLYYAVTGSHAVNGSAYWSAIVPEPSAGLQNWVNGDYAYFGMTGVGTMPTGVTWGGIITPGVTFDGENVPTTCTMHSSTINIQSDPNTHPGYFTMNLINKATYTAGSSTGIFAQNGGTVGLYTTGDGSSEFFVTAGAGAQTYAGGTWIGAGAQFLLEQASWLPTSGNLTLGDPGSSLYGTFRAHYGTATSPVTIPNPVVIMGNCLLDNGNTDNPLIFNHGVTLTGNYIFKINAETVTINTVGINDGGNNYPLGLEQPVQYNAATAPNGYTYGGNLVYAVANTYTGGTTVNCGSIDGQVAGAFSTGGVTINYPPMYSLVINGNPVSGYFSVLQIDNSSAMSTSATLSINYATSSDGGNTFPPNGENAVNLTYAGTMYLSGLVINGVSQPPGVYGASANNPGYANFEGQGTITIPLNATFPITSESVSGLPGSQQVSVTWSSVNGLQYDILTNSVLGTGPGASTIWTPVPGGPFTGTGSSTTITFPSASTSNLFFQLRSP